MIKGAVIDIVHQSFPKVKIAYKNQSLLMRILSTILFFQPMFMSSNITVVGDTVYFPTDHYPNLHPVSSFIILLHELTQINNQHKFGQLGFFLLYCFPQILFLPALLLFLIVSWKIVLPIVLLTLLPWPAYFRMLFEKQAYLSSLYIIHRLNLKYHYGINLTHKKDYFVEQFKGSYYYFVWPFKNIDREFDLATTKIIQGQRPYDDHIFDILDRLIMVF